MQQRHLRTGHFTGTADTCGARGGGCRFDVARPPPCLRWVVAADVGVSHDQRGVALHGVCGREHGRVLGVTAGAATAATKTAVVAAAVTGATTTTAVAVAAAAAAAAAAAGP